MAGVYRSLDAWSLSLFGQESKALIDALVKKGILSDDDAKQLVAEISKTEAATEVSTSNDKILKKLTLTGRIQSSTTA